MHVTIDIAVCTRFSCRLILGLRYHAVRASLRYVCVRHTNDYIQANIALLVLISLVNTVITNFYLHRQHSSLQPIVTPQPRNTADLNVGNV